MPPDPPRGKRASLAPSPSPVTLHYSPATLFLNENPDLRTAVMVVRLTKRRQFSCLCPLSDDKLPHNIVKVAVEIMSHSWLISRGSFDNIMTKFTNNKRTGAWKNDTNLFFTITKPPKWLQCNAHSCVHLTHFHIFDNNVIGRYFVKDFVRWPC